MVFAVKEQVNGALRAGDHARSWGADELCQAEARERSLTGMFKAFITKNRSLHSIVPYTRHHLPVTTSKVCFDIHCKNVVVLVTPN